MPQAAKLFGDSEEGRKMARYFMELQFGNVKAAFDFSDHDDLKGETWAGKEEKPVKPSRKKQTVKRNRKSKAAKADKPLKEKEMEKEEGGGSGQSKSKPVKPGQTVLEKPDEDGLGVGVGLILGKDQADGEDSGTDCLSDQSKLHSAP